jgi:hypothetical protein
MKCPHCGIEVRDTTVICGYCGGKIPQKKTTPASQKGGRADTAGIVPKKAPPVTKSRGREPEPDEEEEEGGLSSLLQPGEQVLIGSLNISVKKFLFHAYLTDRRIFLLDTHEKKLKVTAKDIALDTISGSIVEFSETSDPVLVLSIRAAEDETKTMKLVFTQNGIDRSGEIDEWIALLNEQSQPKKHKTPPVQKVPEPELQSEEGEEPALARVERPAVVQKEFHPSRKPTKDYEKQAPVKRLLSLYQVSKQEEPEEPEKKSPDTRPAEQPAKRTPAQPVTYREIPPSTKHVTQPVKRVEVQSAMKTAMKTAMQQVKQSPVQPVKRPAPELHKKPLHEQEEPLSAVQQKESFEKEEVLEEEPGAPIFCQNCGKKLPAAANFCPGCGTKLGQHKASHEPSSSHERKSHKPESIKDEEKPEHPEKKPLAKKVPKGSEMTILHKFLRR